MSIPCKVTSSVLHHHASLRGSLLWRTAISYFSYQPLHQGELHEGKDALFLGTCIASVCHTADAQKIH